MAAAVDVLSPLVAFSVPVTVLRLAWSLHLAGPQTSASSEPSLLARQPAHSSPRKSPDPARPRITLCPFTLQRHSPCLSSVTLTLYVLCSRHQSCPLHNTLILRGDSAARQSLGPLYPLPGPKHDPAGPSSGPDAPVRRRRRRRDVATQPHPDDIGEPPQ